MVSLIILAYNQHRFLMAALAGISYQARTTSWIELEVVVVDNGSQPPISEADARAAVGDLPLQLIRRPPADRPFRAASARNLGLDIARGNTILFLDGDCVPGPYFLREHCERLHSTQQPSLTLGHRRFISGDAVDADVVHRWGCRLDHLEPVPSASNYGLPQDRRLRELEAIDEHPMPYNCCHGCNLGINRQNLPTGAAFDEEFDGWWGYEDIEFGYRVWKSGVAITYLPRAFVYHLEGSGLSLADRHRHRHHSYELACKKIPGLREFRQQQDRAYYQPP